MAMLSYEIGQKFYEIRDSDAYKDNMGARIQLDTFIDYADAISKNHQPRAEYLVSLHERISYYIEKGWSEDLPSAKEALAVVESYQNV